MAMELNYKNIKELLDGDLFASGMTEDGERIIFQWEKIRGIEPYDDEEVFTAAWVTKRNENGEWWCTHVYHEDGIVEELFEFIGATDYPRKG